MMQHIIIGNFGNHSLAVMQALLEKAIQPIHFVYVKTGWAAALWPERVRACAAYASAHGVIIHNLVAPISFADLVVDRKQFPNRKFQWCASFLKGLAILKCLDELDPSCEALIVSGERQYDSRRLLNLQEFEYENDLYQGRTIWYPLWKTENEEFEKLICRTGFPLLPHQSLECSPCIHTGMDQLNHLDPLSLARLDQLERCVNQTMFSEPILALQATTSIANQQGFDLQQFDRGCGAPWGCGE